MIEVVVAVALTALLGGLLAPSLKERLDRRSERFNSSVMLVDTLANGLWAYWKLALRVAYYARQGEGASDHYDVALQRWDGDDAWRLGTDIQIAVSKSKRLVPLAAQQTLDQAQQAVVEYLDSQIEGLRHSGTAAEWDEFHTSLMTTRRDEIDRLLTQVVGDLKM